MPEKPSSLLPEDATARDRLRAILTVCLVVAVLLAGTVVPATSGAGLGQTPLGSVLPTPGVNVYGPSGSGSGGVGSGGGGLGALNPGQQTAVGGSLASDESTFRSQNAEVHFTVRSTQPSYWRTGAYDIYTGSGWEQSGERRPYTGPVEGEGIQGRQVEYSVSLNRSATALPSVWRANSVSQSATETLYVTDSRAFVTDDPLAPGTTYSGVSHLAPSDPTVLRTAGRDYPAEIEERYTALPAKTERELAPFTDDLTANTTSPYETATRIESWLESNKNYSLDAPKPEGDVASQFVFEMEAGYCEYFATSMVAMLRSQGVPARYVVGYSTGQQVGANTYQVRGMNAHAWVEVYFPEVGWVKFDPTPGQARLQAEQRAYRNQTPDAASDYDPTEEGSPGEEFSPDGESTATPERTVTSDGTAPTAGTVTATASGNGDGATTGPGGTSGTPTEPPTDDGTGSDSDSTTTAGTGDSDGTTAEPGEITTRPPEDGDDTTAGTRYEVELNRTPVPGATVEVTVSPRVNATLVVGAPVYFNGEYVGETDESGTVTAEVPYAENLTITVGSRESDGRTAIGGPPHGFDAPMASVSPPPRSFALGNDTDGNRTGGDQTNGTEYSLATDATLAVSGDVETASKVVVTATVQGVPVRNAKVRLNDDEVATTDANGRAEVRLPDSPGNATISVSRGPVSGQTTVSIPRLAVAVEPTLPLALPGTAVEICATYGGEPVSDARVRLDEENHSTDFNGSTAATLPFRERADVVVTARGQTRRTTVSGLFVNLALVLGGGLALVGGLGFGAYRRGLGPRRLLTALLAGLRSIPDFAVAALFGLTDRVEWTIRTLLEALGDLRAGESTLSELLARLRAWLRERVQAARASASATVAEAAATGENPAPEPEKTDDSYRTLREAWDAFLAVVSVRRPDSSTPGELADHAVREDDLPPGAVVTLRDAFRDVEYGARSPADRLARVEEAIETIESATREAGAETGETDGMAPDSDADSNSGGET